MSPGPGMRTTHPRHLLGVSELFQPLASSQVQVKHVLRPHGGLPMLTNCKERPERRCWEERAYLSQAPWESEGLP